MTESREELIEAIESAYTDAIYSGCGCCPVQAEEVSPRIIDAILAHPSAVLSELENAPCQTCGGARVALQFGATRRGDESTCRACGGSGKLGRDGLLRALGMEQVGWALWDEYSDLVDVRAYELGDATLLTEVPVFARVPVPEPSEGEK